MSGRTKHVEVSSARNRLDATLQSLVEKKDDGQDVLFDSDGELEVVVPTSLEVLSDSSMSSPSKRILGPRSRKRKRKDDVIETDTGSYHHTYVMKLFDRSVDLAQFDEDTALYPIARAWITNQPYKREENRERSASPEPEMQASSEEEVIESYPNVYNMPVPIKQETGMSHIDLRIPPQLPSREKPLDIHADPDKGPPPEELLLRHMDRWKRIRNTWIKASRTNELRYQPSMTLLKDMFEHQHMVPASQESGPG